MHGSRRSAASAADLLRLRAGFNQTVRRRRVWRSCDHFVERREVLGKIRWGLDLAMFCAGFADPTQRIPAASPAPLKELRAPIDRGIARSALSVVFHSTSIMADYRTLCRIWGGAFRVRPLAGLKGLRSADRLPRGSGETHGIRFCSSRSTDDFSSDGSITR
jgi:hypothetical protein